MRLVVNKVTNNVRRFVGRGIIAHEHLQVRFGVRQCFNRLQAFEDIGCFVACRNENGDFLHKFVFSAKVNDCRGTKVKVFGFMYSILSKPSLIYEQTMKANRLINSIKKSALLEREEQRVELGFGTQLTGLQGRLVNPDGSFNAKRVNVSFWAWADIFHRLTLLSWPRFFVVVFLIYFVVNCLFSLLYLVIGVENLQGIHGTGVSDKFWGAFFFSAQTLTTVGYGHVSPAGLMASALSSVESLVGVLGFAIATGLVYSRFSRPVPKILFSQNAIFAPYLDINAWMFRMINESPNELVDVNVSVSLSRLETLPSGQRTRKYYPLKLERNQVNFFPMHWTLVHPLTEESPLYGVTEEGLRDSDTEILVYIRATEETFLQPVHARYSYRYEEITWGAKFRPMFDGTKVDGIVKVDVQKIHEFDKVSLN